MNRCCALSLKNRNKFTSAPLKSNAITLLCRSMPKSNLLDLLLCRSSVRYTKSVITPSRPQSTGFQTGARERAAKSLVCM